jgi:hypothetical protein
VQRIVDGVPDDVSHDIGFGPCADVVQTDLVKADVRASVGLTITGRVANTAPLTVVEYFHTGFGHYFMTADPAEIAGLDGGAYGGVFSRTARYSRSTAPRRRDLMCASSPSRSRRRLTLLHRRPPECAGSS